MEKYDELMLRRKTYYALNEGFTDDFSISKVPFVESENIVEDAIDYLTKHSDIMVYPGKSYAIAICYAYWMEQLGAGTLLSSLSDSMLLNGDDPYFKPLQVFDLKDPYMQIIENVSLPDLFDDTSGLPTNLPYLAMTKKYFLEEFQLTPEARQNMPFYLGNDNHFKWCGNLDAVKKNISSITDIKKARIIVSGNNYSVAVPDTAIYDVDL